MAYDLGSGYGLGSDGSGSMPAVWKHCRNWAFSTEEAHSQDCTVSLSLSLSLARSPHSIDDGGDVHDTDDDDGSDDDDDADDDGDEVE